MQLSPRASRTDVAVVGIAVLAWAACLLLTTTSPLGASCLVVAGAATALALSGPWQRKRMVMAIEAATRIAELRRAELQATSAAHAARWQAIVDTAIEGIVIAGRPLEIETVNGAVVRQARALGIPVPYNETVYAGLKLLAAGQPSP